MIAEFIVEILFFTLCGWIGRFLVKLVTFGKIDLEWGSGSESVLATWLGFFFALFTAGLVTWLLSR